LKLNGQGDKQDSETNAPDFLSQLGLGGDLFKSLDVNIDEDEEDQSSSKDLDS
jgi:hypothetical protein